MASFLPHFLSLDCCLATFSQKFCLLSGRVKRHSLHSLLSHLAHTVASTVELFNSTGFLAHIMISFSFSNHYISFRISRVPSHRAYSTLIVISTKLHQAGWYSAHPLHLPTPTPPQPARPCLSPLPFCCWGEVWCFWKCKAGARSSAPGLVFGLCAYHAR